MDWNLGLLLMDFIIEDFFAEDPLILNIGESGKDFNSASDIT